MVIAAQKFTLRQRCVGASEASFPPEPSQVVAKGDGLRVNAISNIWIMRHFWFISKDCAIIKAKEFGRHYVFHIFLDLRCLLVASLFGWPLSFLDVFSREEETRGEKRRGSGAAATTAPRPPSRGLFSPPSPATTRRLRPQVSSRLQHLRILDLSRDINYIMENQTGAFD